MIAENELVMLLGELESFRVERTVSVDKTDKFAQAMKTLGAITRSALIASDHVCLPLAPDLFSLQRLKNLVPTLRQWRSTWKELVGKAPPDLSLPSGSMISEGYLVVPHGMRDKRPFKAYQRWMDKILQVYRIAVLGASNSGTIPSVQNDPYLLAELKHYRSLMPLAMEANKPMFSLKPADGAIGAHVSAVSDCYKDFLSLARKLATGVDIELEYFQSTF